MNRTPHEELYLNYYNQRLAQGAARSLTKLSPVPHAAGAVSLTGEKQALRNFSSNDYLGLSRDLRLIERGCEYANRYGAGSGASRLVSGNLEIFEEIEAELALFKQREAALVFSSGFSAESGVIAALLSSDVIGAEPTVFFDKLNHAGMYFGAAAAGVTPIRFRHNDASHLENLLQKHDHGKKPIFILTESVFSMDGDLAPLAEICRIGKRHNAFIIVDDAHAFGILGENGAGVASAHPEIDLIIGTFSKACGGSGGYVVCSDLIRNYLLQKCATFIYSTAPAPFTLGAILESLQIIKSAEGETLREITAKKAKDLRALFDQIAGDYGNSVTHIVPLMIKAPNDGLKLVEALIKKNIYAKLIRPPTVPPGGERIRFSVNPHIRDEEIAAILNVIKETGFV